MDVININEGAKYERTRKIIFPQFYFILFKMTKDF